MPNNVFFFIQTKLVDPFDEKSYQKWQKKYSKDLQNTFFARCLHVGDDEMYLGH